MTFQLTEPHFELRDDDGLVVEYLDAPDGNVVERFEGPTSRQLWQEHIDGECVGMCPFCYEESERYLQSLAQHPDEERCTAELFRDMKKGIVPPPVDQSVSGL